MTQNLQPRAHPGIVGDDVLDLTCALMRCASVTPNDGGAQEIIRRRLEPLGFTIEFINRGEVTNLWAVRTSRHPNAPHLMFAGHTDVVPSGPIEAWESPPFEPMLRDGYLYGRGAADMKSSLAAMVVAVEEYLAVAGDEAMTVSFLITSDEEGDAVDGTAYVVEQLAARGVRPTFCIVGEPSSDVRLGDVVRCGRRGSLNAQLTIHGIQGHVAYPDLAENPVHSALAALNALTTHQWDAGNEYYPPTSLQISNINAGTGATNVIPGELIVQFNLRYSTEQTAQGIRAVVEALLDEHRLRYSLDWQHSGAPFLTRRGPLTDAVVTSINEVTGGATELSTAGGTSDGRFIAPWAPQAQQDAAELPPVPVVELGPVNATIHKVNECVAVVDLAPLCQIYTRILHSVAAATDAVLL